ncbi:rbn [Symbiodinium microadriaticum]|nr:rbn [Symbiodinium microadriaticum]
MNITFQFWNDSSFESYNPQAQQTLYQSLLQNPRPDEVDLPQSPYVISNFNKVEHGGASQRNKKSGFNRWVRIRPPYLLPGAQPSAAAFALPRDLRFCFEEGRDGSQLVPFSEELQSELKRFLASSPRPSEVYFVAKHSPYLLSGMDQIQDLQSDSLAQVNLKTGFVRRVRITTGPIPRVPQRPYGGAASSHVPPAFSGTASGGRSFQKRSFHPPTPARANSNCSFSVSSAAFFCTVDGRRERLNEAASRLLLRQWIAAERPSEVDLKEDGVVENFEEVKLPEPSSGTLRLPEDLDEAEALDMMLTGKALTDQEIVQLVGDERQCPICMDAMEPEPLQPEVLDEDGDVEDMHAETNASFSWARDAPPVQGAFRLRCGHTYHMTCLRTWFQQKTRCPSCQQEFGKVVGKQPRLGTFSWHCENFTLPGHPDAVKTIVIQFMFPEGIDDEGKSYAGRKPKGYLPCNAQGIILLELFKVAFRRRVMFGMGESMTFSSYRPTFNIHIKTSSSGGETKHGYPDETYFQRSLGELKANGVILLTHLHGDHCYGLFGLLQTAALEGRKDPLLIVGPQGLRTMVETVLLSSGGWYSEESFQINYLEIPNTGTPGGESLVGPFGSGPRGLGFHPDRCRHAAAVQLGVLAGLRIQAVPLVHGLPDWGYVLTEPDRPGKLNAAKALELGIPAKSRMLGQLKQGQTVRLDDGSMVSPAQVLGPTIPGRTVAILQDTSDASAAIEPCRGAACVVHEATFEDGMETEAIGKGHSTSTMAARFAASCQAMLLPSWFAGDEQ